MANTTNTKKAGIQGISVSLLCAIAVFGALVGYQCGLNIMLSFEVGFVGNVCIVGSSFLAMLKKLKHLPAQESPKTHSKEGKNKQGAKEKGAFFTDFSTKFTLGTQMSIAFLRILSYLALAGAIIALFKYELFSFVGFFVGLFVALVALIGLSLWYIKAS
ncbi:hypothetical protein LS71_006580 [Helicobacter jaachi]|uniref:Uncharacterized protein n=1 Tax=Helicobacter jaachi TaxID=1677920 RepID=A0A4U8T9P4_9HELI|nr:hypothetical protein [Helicobacter jaachi]TLD96383.1 hypothetical protein LS71_006580 [Helicobacter jaachi]